MRGIVREYVADPVAEWLSAPGWGVRDRIGGQVLSVACLNRGSIEQPRRGVLDQPRATPWVLLSRPFRARVALDRIDSQGVALGCPIVPFQGKDEDPHAEDVARLRNVDHPRLKCHTPSGVGSGQNHLTSPRNVIY